MTPSRARLLAILTVLGFSAGCDDDTRSDDNVAPAIVATTPADDARGVLPDVAITFTFTEAMNEASVEAAYSSVALPASAVSFAWSDDGTTLTITPDDPLDLDLDFGRDYEVSIGRSASDLAGNRLEAPFVLSFVAAALVHVELAAIPNLSGTNFDGSSIVASELRIGDTGTDTEYAAVASFDVGSLPSGTLGIAGATFAASLNDTVGTPFATLGGAITLYTVSYSALAEAAQATPSGTVGTFSSSDADTLPSIDVTDEIAADYEDRVAQGGLSQYRLCFATPSNANGSADYASFDVSLTVIDIFVYVMP